MGNKVKYGLVICVVYGLSYIASADSYVGDSTGGTEDQGIAVMHNEDVQLKHDEPIVSDAYLTDNTKERGDFNQDGAVDMWDLAILKHFTRQPLGSCPECDLDNDHEITPRDAKTLLSLCTFPHCISNEEGHNSNNL